MGDLNDTGHLGEYQQASDGQWYPVNRPKPPSNAALNLLMVVGGFIAVAIVLGLASVMFGADDPPPATVPPNGTSIDAIDVCHQQVTDQLKAPATAQFQPSESATNVGARWTVSGSVDAQNGFGALIRSDYVCIATYDGTGGWNVTATVS